MLKPTDSSKSNNHETPMLQPLGFTDILDGMFSLYRSHFRVFVGIAAVDIFAECIGQVLIDFPHFIQPSFFN